MSLLRVGVALLACTSAVLSAGCLAGDDGVDTSDADLKSKVSWTQSFTSVQLWGYDHSQHEGCARGAFLAKSTHGIVVAGTASSTGLGLEEIARPGFARLDESTGALTSMSPVGPFEPTGDPRRIPGSVTSLGVSGDDVLIGLGGSATPDETDAILRFDGANQAHGKIEGLTQVAAADNGDFVTAAGNTIERHRADGTLVWSYVRPDDPGEAYPFLAGAIAFGAGDTVYALATYGTPKLVKLVDGQAVWTTELDLTGTARRPLARAKDGTLFVLGKSGWSDTPHVIKIDDAGAVRGEVDLTGLSHVKHLDAIAATADGRIALAGAAATTDVGRMQAPLVALLRADGHVYFSTVDTAKSGFDRGAAADIVADGRNLYVTGEGESCRLYVTRYRY